MKKAQIPYPPHVELARLPTPIQPLKRLGEKLGVELYVKRDDLTEVACSGNKIRKLEFSLADALAQGADTVIKCGGAQSNHSRATAISAARLGLRWVGCCSAPRIPPARRRCRVTSSSTVSPGPRSSGSPPRTTGGAMSSSPGRQTSSGGKAAGLT